MLRALSSKGGSSYWMFITQKKRSVIGVCCCHLLGGGALYPEIDQSGPTANGMSSKQHQSISFHFCLLFLSDRELLDCSNCAIPTNCQGEAKFHLRSVKVSRSQNPAGKGYRVCTLPGGIWARTMDQTLSFGCVWNQRRLKLAQEPVASHSSCSIWRFFRFGNSGASWSLKVDLTIIRRPDRLQNLIFQHQGTLWPKTKRIFDNTQRFSIRTTHKSLSRLWQFSRIWAGICVPDWIREFCLFQLNLRFPNGQRHPKGLERDGYDHFWWFVGASGRRFGQFDLERATP